MMSRQTAQLGTVLFALLLLFGGACGSAAVAPAHPSPESSAAPKAFIWHFTPPEGQGKEGYLLGSVHLANSEMYPLDPVIEDAYEQAQTLIVEVDTTAVSPQELGQLMVSNAALPEGQTLEQKLSPETWDRLREALRGTPIPIEGLARFKPWFVAITLIVMQFEQAGYKSELGIDHYFLSKKDKPVGQLENAEFQINLFNGFSDELQELMLLDALEDPEAAFAKFKDMVAAWQAGDTAAMEELVYGELRDHPEFRPLYEKLYVARNYQMIDRIEDLHQQHDRIFVVVGAAHLVGEEGLVALFKNRGYTIRQLTRKAPPSAE